MSDERELAVALLVNEATIMRGGVSYEMRVHRATAIVDALLESMLLVRKDAVVIETPEYEYQARSQRTQPWRRVFAPGTAYVRDPDEQAWEGETVRRRVVGPWEPVEKETPE